MGLQGIQDFFDFFSLVIVYSVSFVFLEGIHAFCDFTIRDSVSGLNFMNSPLLRDFEEKNILMMNILLMMDNYSCQSDSF